MKTYIISYDLKNTKQSNQRYKKLYQAISSYEYAQLTKKYHYWKIKTVKSRFEIERHLRKCINWNDNLEVRQIVGGWRI